MDYIVGRIDKNHSNYIEEQGYLDDIIDLDIDLNDSKDFSLTTYVNRNTFDLSYENFIFRIGTEFGGMLGERDILSKNDTQKWIGKTFRGILNQIIVCPLQGQEHYIVSGDANACIDKMLDKVGANVIFTAGTGEYYDHDLSGINVEFKFRYNSLLEVFERDLAKVGARLHIECSHHAGSGMIVFLTAVKAKDFSEQIEISQDGGVSFHLSEKRDGIIHLICLGKGEGVNRLVVHLYRNKDGSINTTSSDFEWPYLSGQEAVYDYNSIEDRDELITEGTKKLKELSNYQSIAVNYDSDYNDIEMNIGDIVGGRDYNTNTVVKVPIENKIIRLKDGIEKIEYKMKE